MKIHVNLGSLFQVMCVRVVSKTSKTIYETPNGESLPARLIQQTDGDYKVEWTPHMPGRHAIDAGKGNQEIRIESPSGRNVPFEVTENPPLEYHVSYTPNEAGQHKIFITYSNMELNVLRPSTSVPLSTCASSPVYDSSGSSSSSSSWI
ncbi:filamin-c [Plakobranchus ocellatus]|uniref:Filamin-c n=1 Tax=Plakobranchus ocellatus TaxID=259542 RepID=A0AAV4BQE2_9GAST|nr:filamin-c [Plakobranchus ocellatus]